MVCVLIGGMATNASLLAKIDTAIEGLLDSLADDAMTEYSFKGKSYKRAEFDTLLNSLMKSRTTLQQQIAASSNRVRVAKLGNARRSG